MTISEWQKKIAKTHPSSIDLNIDRVKAVAEKLHVISFSCPVITVTGTNGKGSCVALLEKIYLSAGYSVGAFISPYLYKINEQIRLNGRMIEDVELAAIFTKIDALRADITLTEFEFTTLAALLLFSQFSPDIILLEVGMGGARDAVNVVSADLAIVTNVHYDHMQFLGADREQIAKEKAGIFRRGKIAIYGEDDPPQAILDKAKQENVTLYRYGVDFQYNDQDNAAALMAVKLFQHRLPVSDEAIAAGINGEKLPGRYQRVTRPVMQIFDGAHNPAAAKWLAKKLIKEAHQYKNTYAVFSMLEDKDIEATIVILKKIIRRWYVAPLNVKRGAPLALLVGGFEKNDIQDFLCFNSVEAAYSAALAAAHQDDRVVIFGSFHTVASCKNEEVLKACS